VIAEEMSEGRGSSNANHIDQKIPKPFLYSMIPLNLVVGLTVIFLNTLVGHFYRKGKRSTAALLYIYLTSWDVTIGVTAVTHAIYMIVTVIIDVQSNVEAVKILVCGVYVVTNVAVRMSVFANTVLSVVRTINIALPFYQVRRKSLHIAYWMCFAVLLAFCASDIKFTLKRTNQNGLAIPFPEFRNDLLFNPALGASILEELHLVQKVQRVQELMRDTLVSNGFFHLASLIALACLAAQSRILLSNSFNSMRTDAARRSAAETSTDQPDEQRPGTKPGESERRNSEMRTTITIIQLTTVFCLCNTAYTVFVIWIFSNLSRNLSSEPPISNRLASYITSTFVPFLNSLINPLILIMRSEGLRHYVKSKLIAFN
jgi:hypothetical protein